MSTKSKFEIRALTGTLTAPDASTRSIHGLAIATGQQSALINGQFYETIEPQAVNDQLIKSNDIKLYLNHDESQGTLARSKFGEGSLKLSVTDKGLEFDTVLPKTAKADEVIAGIQRGDIDAVSFAFKADQDQWDEMGTDKYKRDILSFALIDEISLLSCLPAYSATEVTLRSLDAFKAKEAESRADSSTADSSAADSSSATKTADTSAPDASTTDSSTQKRSLDDYYSQFDLGPDPMEEYYRALKENLKK